MNKTVLTIIVVLIGMGFFLSKGTTPSHAEDKETITWYSADFPPLSIPNGPKKGKGYNDLQVNMLINRLDNYEAKYRTANFKRIVQQIQKQEKACCASLIKKPEREIFMEFSIPWRVSFNNGIIFNKADRNKFASYIDKNGIISLKRIIDDGNLKLGISHGRSYKKEIDQIIDKVRKSEHVVEQAGQDVFQGLLYMLRKGRVDYILGYPHEAQYIASKMGKAEYFSFHTMAEIAKPYTIAYVGCPKNQWGKAVIKAANKIIKEIRVTPEFLGFYESYLDEDSKKAYKKMAQDYFKK